MNQLALLYKAMGKLADAIKLHEETLRRRRATLGADHPDTVTSIGNLVSTYLAAEQPEKSLRLLPEFLAGKRKQLGPESARMAYLLVNVAQDLLLHQQSREAEKLGRAGLEILQRKEPNDHQTCDAQALLGRTLLAQGKYAEAEPLLLQGYDGMKRRAAGRSSDAQRQLRAAARALVQLYEAWGKPVQAAHWRQELPETNELPPSAGKP